MRSTIFLGNDTNIMNKIVKITGINGNKYLNNVIDSSFEIKFSNIFALGFPIINAMIININAKIGTTIAAVNSVWLSVFPIYNIVI